MNQWRKYETLTLAAALVFVSGGVAAQKATARQQAGVIEVTISADTPAAPTLDVVQVMLHGELFSAEAQPPEPKDFVDKVVRTYADGSIDDALGLWEVSERESLRRAMQTENDWLRNQAFYKGIEKSTIRARVDYGGYQLLVVQHIRSATVTTKVYPTVAGQRRLLTNRLHSDDVFLLLVRRLASTMIAVPGGEQR